MVVLGTDHLLFSAEHEEEVTHVILHTVVLLLKEVLNCFPEQVVQNIIFH